MDAIRKIEAVNLPVAAWLSANEYRITFGRPSSDPKAEALVKFSDTIAALASKDAEIARLREALEWYAEIGTSTSPDGLVTIADAGKVARAALTQPTEQP